MLRATCRQKTLHDDCWASWMLDQSDRRREGLVGHAAIRHPLRVGISIDHKPPYSTLCIMLRGCSSDQGTTHELCPRLDLDAKALAMTWVLRLAWSLRPKGRFIK